jgi:hypothetical protein
MLIGIITKGTDCVAIRTRACVHKHDTGRRPTQCELTSGAIALDWFSAGVPQYVA